MSRIDPSPPEPAPATERRRLTAAERATLLSRQQDRCAGACQESLVWSLRDGRPIYGPMVDEHVIPLELGGSNDLTNRALFCVACAKAKTHADRKAIHKAARIRRRLEGDERPKAKIRSRGFPRDPLTWRDL